MKNRHTRDSNNLTATRLVRSEKRPLNRKKIDAICAKIRALPVLDPRTPDEILSYDEHGVPR